MTPLRQRFIHDLQLRNRSPRTVQAYVHHLKQFALFFGTAPDRLNPDHVRRYLLHLVHEKHASWSAYNQAAPALRFFFMVTCPTDILVSRIPYGKRPKKLLQVRSAEAKLLAGVRSPVITMLLRTIYACGLRLGEALALELRHDATARAASSGAGRGGASWGRAARASRPGPPSCCGGAPPEAAWHARPFGSVGGECRSNRRIRRNDFQASRQHGLGRGYWSSPLATHRHQWDDLQARNPPATFRSTRYGWSFQNRHGWRP